jgi:hypothetical protein
MMSNTLVDPVYREGDEVVLAEGSYQGTLGILLRLREDVNWADITQRNGRIRSHPVVWLAHATSETPGFGNWNHGSAEDHNG